MSVSLRSGTNAYHGAAWWYVRNDILNANSYFNTSRGLPERKVRQHDFGFNFGGPLVPTGKWRDKLFLFVNYEQQYLPLTQTRSNTILTQEAEQGIFRYQSATGEQRIDPGDLLCRSRDGTDYATLADRRREFGSNGATHCDVVVKMDAREARVLVIGGNVFQSVSLTLLPLTRDRAAFPHPIDKSLVDGAITIFAHLKLKAQGIDANALDNSPAIRVLAGR